MRYVCPYSHIKPYSDCLPTRTSRGIIIAGYSGLYSNSNFWFQYKLWEALSNPFFFQTTHVAQLRSYFFRKGLNL